ncbi:MAG: EAL domain-containing protein [Alphaproteobacteria bacterium]|nr:EAL domain-containing protein [Alphaproteobacteria bacterium]
MAVRDRKKIRKSTGRNLADFQLLSFLPLFIVAAYWIKTEAILFVISFMFPLLLAFQSLIGRSDDTSDEAPLAEDDRDFLTGLANRRRTRQRLTQFLDSERNTGRETAVLHIDIDRFRLVNDRYGMETGDRVLAEIGARIRSCVRENDLVARIDGDDFAIVLFPIKKADFALALSLADRVRAAIAQPFSIDHITCYLTCSIGICLSGRAPVTEAESVLASAEIALELARREGPDATRSFSPKMRREARKLHSLSAELEAALENGQIRPYFQPQICTDTGEVAGFEALARWEHPQSGLILPGLFLRAIESTGRSERLGEVILYHSLSALKSWDRAGLRIPSIGVNFSSDELRNPKLVEKIKWEVDRFEIAPARITIEVLENVVSDHDDDVITRNIRSLAAQGFGIDLDDFGTGHAAIANIRRFAVNRIKIDRSFITKIDSDTEQQVLTSAIIGMAESLGLETLAEGVETMAEHGRLAQMGCRYIQGFGIARPMPFEDTIAWLHKHRDKLAKGQGTDRRAG